MSHCVEKLPHKCGSSDGLQVFKDNKGEYDGYCFSCGTYVPDPYMDKPAGYKPAGFVKSPEQVAEELSEIAAYQVVDLPERKLRAESLAYFGVRIGLSEYDGSTPLFHYYPSCNEVGEVQGYKVRFVPSKAMWSVGTTKGSKMFGWPQAVVAGGKTLFITEGELDAVALFQALKDKAKGGKWELFNPSVVSIRNGAGGAVKDIQDHAQEIRAKYKDVVLVFDKDDAGRAATTEVIKIFPTARVADIPAKDANEAVIQGRGMALCNAVLFQAAVPKNTRLVRGTSLIEAARTQALYGLSWPWKGITKLTRGIRFGETYYLGAGVKMGKSELVNTLGAHLVVEHNLPCFFAKPEEANRKSFQLLCGKVAGKIFHDPDVVFDYDAYDKASATVAERTFFLDLYQHMGWEGLRADIMAAVHEGCRAVFIDPITNLTSGEAVSDQNVMLQEIARELSSMAKDLNIVIFIFCHLKAPTVGDSHERGGKVLSHQFAGSRAMMQACNLMLGLEGTKDPDLTLEERNMRKLIILEDREFGSTGSVSLYWDHKTGLFNEV